MSTEKEVVCEDSIGEEIDYTIRNWDELDLDRNILRGIYTNGSRRFNLLFHFVFYVSIKRVMIFSVESHFYHPDPSLWKDSALNINHQHCLEQPLSND